MSENEQRLKLYKPGGATGKGWAKGVSGNPKGRPRRRLLSEELTELLQERIDPSDLESPTRLKVIATALADKCQQGDTKALDVLVKVYEPRRPGIDARRLEINCLTTLDDLKGEIAAFIADLPALINRQPDALEIVDYAE